MMTLYGYWRSSAAYRVRIALNLKQLDYQQRSVHLVKNGGEQHQAKFKALNPSELVPVLVDGELKINQSLTIIDYLDEKYSGIRLVPREGDTRYLVKSLAQDIAIDIHPLNNLRILEYLTTELGVEVEQKTQWYQHWISRGFAALETQLQACRGRYCVGDELSLVDVCLVPQVYNAERFKVDMSPYPVIRDVSKTLRALTAFDSASPERQPDAE